MWFGRGNSPGRPRAAHPGQVPDAGVAGDGQWGQLRDLGCPVGGGGWLLQTFAVCGPTVAQRSHAFQGLGRGAPAPPPGPAEGGSRWLGAADAPVWRPGGPFATRSTRPGPGGQSLSGLAGSDRGLLSAVGGGWDTGRLRARVWPTAVFGSCLAPASKQSGVGLAAARLDT